MTVYTNRRVVQQEVPYLVDTASSIDECSFGQSSETGWLTENHSMTLLGSMNCGDHLLLAADSGIGVEAVVLLRPKLNIVPGRSLAWGIVGNESLGAMFRDWLDSTKSDRWSDWNMARDAALGKVNEINQWRRISAANAGLDPNRLKDDDFLEVLLVGYIGGVPQFLSSQH
jgi:hypothetical protein